MELKLKQINKRLIIGLSAAALAIILSITMIVLFSREDTTLRTYVHQSPPLQFDPAAPLPENPYTSQDFILQEQYLTCTAGNSLLAIDVSRIQETIDWQQVRQAGVEIAMIRVGGRGYGQAGALYEDALALANYTAAKEAGIRVGVYFFSQATTPAEAREEARFVLSLTEGWELDMPVVFDWENMGPDTRTEHVDTQLLIRCTQAFCRTITRAGREAMIYFNLDQSRDPAYLQQLQCYPFWLALYSDEMNFPYRVDMWQYTDEGTVPGIEQPVDINLYFPYQ